jgi:hypothetical protein
LSGTYRCFGEIAKRGTYRAIGTERSNVRVDDEAHAIEHVHDCLCERFVDAGVNQDELFDRSVDDL